MVSLETAEYNRLPKSTKVFASFCCNDNVGNITVICFKLLILVDLKSNGCFF